MAQEDSGKYRSEICWLKNSSGGLFRIKATKYSKLLVYLCSKKKKKLYRFSLGESFSFALEFSWCLNINNSRWVKDLAFPIFYFLNIIFYHSFAIHLCSTSPEHQHIYIGTISWGPFLYCNRMRARRLPVCHGLDKD